LANSRIRFHTPSREQVPTLTRCARQKLLQYSWPGNVRELDNVIQRALILCDGRHIDADTIHIDDRVDQSPLPTPREESDSMEPACLGDDLKLRERDLILEALRAESGNRQAAARRLGISPRTLRYKIARIREQGLGMPVILGWEGA
jgi:two-component system response regulator FlrC